MLLVAGSRMGNLDVPYEAYWGRSGEFELLDPWTNNFYNIISATYRMLQAGGA